MIGKKSDVIAYLISEQTTSCKPKILSETTNPAGGGSVIIDTDLQDSSEFNRNGRNYPKPILNDGLNKENIVELIRRKGWVGEAGHPIQPTVQRQMSILHSNISHRINNWRWEGSIVKGQVESLPTDRGKEFRDCILSAMEVSFSLRALGPVKKTERGDVVQSPLSVVTYDWVFLPSHRGAYMTGIAANNTNGNALSESYCIPLLQESAINYIKEESENFKLVSNCLEFAYKDIILSEDSSNIIIKNGKESLIVNVENYIQGEINSYMSKFNR